MGNKPTRNELLAEYYLRAAGVAAVWVDADGYIGAKDVARLYLGEEGRIAFCCTRGVHFVLAYRLELWKQEHPEADRATLIDRLAQLAAEGSVGLTPHAVAIERALAAVAAVNEAIEKMTACGDLDDFNRAFKAARKADPTIRYPDHLDAKKAAMLDALANGEGQ